jgi:hypothetical protein
MGQMSGDEVGKKRKEKKKWAPLFGGWNEGEI